MSTSSDQREAMIEAAPDGPGIQGPIQIGVDAIAVLGPEYGLRLRPPDHGGIHGGHGAPAAPYQ